MGENYFRDLRNLLTGMSSEDYARHLLKCIEDEKENNNTDAKEKSLHS